MTYKDYKINSHNSLVNGHSGKQYDWSKFNWSGETWAETVTDPQLNWLSIKHKSIKPFVDGHDDSFGEYLHVPYDWEENETIYRVYSRWQVGKSNHGKIPIKVQAIKKDDGWYWRIIWEETK